MGLDDEARRLRYRMVDRLLGNGELPVEWEDAVRAVPRHLFVPDVFWHSTARGFLPLDRAGDEDAWLGIAYRDERVVAQVDDGAPDGFGRQATSSVVSPSELGAVLAAVDVQPGMRVCVVGAGLGYLAAVLAHRLGTDQVSAVEIDGRLADECFRRLRRADLAVSVTTTDGTTSLGTPGRVDRLVCTATVRQVPPLWLTAVGKGGVIVTGFGTTLHNDALLRLTVRSKRKAVGRVVGELACEWVHQQRLWPALWISEAAAAAAGVSTTTLDLNDVAEGFDVSFAVGALVPECASVFVAPDDQWFVDHATGSWARLHLRLHRPHLVNQSGPRALWGEITAAHERWVALGRPGAGEWRVAVADGVTAIEPPVGAAVPVPVEVAEAG